MCQHLSYFCPRNSQNSDSGPSAAVVFADLHSIRSLPREGATFPAHHPKHFLFYCLSVANVQRTTTTANFNIKKLKSEGHKGVRGITPLIGNVDIRSEVTDELHAPAALHLGGGGEGRYPLNRKMNWILRDGLNAWKRGILPGQGIEPRFLRRPARSPVTIPTTMSKLSLKR